jgi:hypothetical protein
MPIVRCDFGNEQDGKLRVGWIVFQKLKKPEEG